MKRSIRHALRHVLIAVAAVFLFVASPAGAVADDAVELIIVHQNDFHGRLEPVVVDGAAQGGLAHIAGLVQELRALHPGKVLWLDGGDTWHGTTLANAFSGESVVDAFNAAGLDAMALGNHEFNYDQEHVVAMAKEANFAVLSSNIKLGDGAERLVHPYALFERDGLTVGVFGLTTPNTVWAAHPRNTAGLTFHDPIAVAKELVPLLDAQADVVVAVTHLGYEEDLRLAEAVPGIDVIVGGHSHTALFEPVRVGDTVIVQAGEHGKYLGVLHLHVEAGRIVAYDGRLVPVTAKTPVHAGVAARLEEWNVRLADRFEQYVGENPEHLEGERARVRTSQTNLGNLMASLMREWLDAEVGFVNSGSIRASIPAGAVRMQEVYDAVPFDNRVVGVKMTGAALLEALEHGVQGYPLDWGGFPQVSGIDFTFDPDRPRGERIVEVRVNGEPLEYEREYSVAITDFLASGGDGYTVFASASSVGTGKGDGPFLRDLLVDYFIRSAAKPAEQMK